MYQEKRILSANNNNLNSLAVLPNEILSNRSNGRVWHRADAFNQTKMTVLDAF